MPPLPNVPNVVKVVTNITADTLTPLFITHLQYTGGVPSGGDCESIAINWGTNFVSTFASLYPATWGVGIVTVTDLSSSSGGVGEVNINSLFSNVNAALPGQVCMLLHKTIGRRYRGGHPRTYLPPFATDSKLNDFQWTGGAAHNAGLNWDAVINAVGAGGPYGVTNIVGEVNVSYRTGNAPRVTPVVDTILSVTGEQNMATQRRRLKRTA